MTGTWIIEESDRRALESWGNVLMKFDEDRTLIYVIAVAKSDQAIQLRYSVEGQTLIPTSLRRRESKGLLFLIGKRSVNAYFRGCSFSIQEMETLVGKNAFCATNE